MHYRDARPGNFHLHTGHFGPDPIRHPTPSVIRFAASNGGSTRALWDSSTNPRGDVGTNADTMLREAGLDWSTERRDVMVPRGLGEDELTVADHYRALVRPDTGQVMSVVSHAYAVAENRWVARATEAYASRLGNQAPMIAAVGFGQHGERTLFAARIAGDEPRALGILANNTHGTEGAVRFQIVEFDRDACTTYVLDSIHASRTFPHVGDLEDRLGWASRSDQTDTFIEKYLAETVPLWDRLRDCLWTTRHTTTLIRHLWGDTPPLTTRAPNGTINPTGDSAARHPGHHLPHSLADTTDAANAYRALCDWIDNRSDACERGDFTKDRDERLALGAGHRYKRNAWRWILDNT